MVINMDQIKTGKFIAELRKEQGLTQETLGEKMRVSNKTISRWETGAYMPDIDKLQELAQILNVSINELLSGEKITDPSEFIKEADKNIIYAMSEKSAFDLKDRIVFFKQKWRKEHMSLIILLSVVFIAVVIIAIIVKKILVNVLIPICGFTNYIYMYNRMMAYVEQKAFDINNK